MFLFADFLALDGVGRRNCSQNTIYGIHFITPVNNVGIFKLIFFVLLNVLYPRLKFLIFGDCLLLSYDIDYERLVGSLLVFLRLMERSLWNGVLLSYIHQLKAVKYLPICALRWR